MINSNKKYGFTLMELMVAVIIIAVLAAVAVPQYKKAVLKSRYSTLMPVANSLAKGNEVYYLSQGEYSKQESKLDVEGQVSAPEGTEIVLETDPEYLSYVRVSNESKVPNARYVVYQAHSKNFAGTTMCEAYDDTAKELCQSLGGVFVSENGTESNWTAYLLSGELAAGDAFSDGTNEEEEEENGGGSSTQPDIPIPDRELLEGYPSCQAYDTWGGRNVKCNYAYTSGETMEERQWIGGVRIGVVNPGEYNENFSLQNGEGSDYPGYTEIKLTNANDTDKIYYDAEGNLVGGVLSRNKNNVSLRYDPNGVVGLTIADPQYNPKPIPGYSYVRYDAQGNVREINASGTTYTYDANGESANSNAPDVTQYKLTGEQMAAVAGEAMNTALLYSTKTKCQIFQDAQGC